MPSKRKVFDAEGHAHFVTFSCYRRRRLLDNDRAKGIVIHFLAEELNGVEGACKGFVIMPDHVHALLHFKQKDMLSHFMQQSKRKSSIRLKQFIKEHLPPFVATMNPNEPIRQPRFYDFYVFSGSKVREKLEYMHNNPVKNGLVKQAEDWAYGSARWYLMKRSVGVEIAPLD